MSKFAHYHKYFCKSGLAIHSKKMEDDASTFFKNRFWRALDAPVVFVSFSPLSPQPKHGLCDFISCYLGLILWLIYLLTVNGLQLSCMSQGYLWRILKCQMALAQPRHTVIGEVVQEKQCTLHFRDFDDNFNKRFFFGKMSFFCFCFFSNIVPLSQEPSHTLPYQRLRLTTTCVMISFPTMLFFLMNLFLKILSPLCCVLGFYSNLLYWLTLYLPITFLWISYKIFMYCNQLQW